MSYGSLFERLGGETVSRPSNAERAALLSVARHLSRMLSTRAGSVQALPDYGLPDLNDMHLSRHDSVQQARAAIEGFISRYEPRLRHVKVAPIARHHDPLLLAFTIEGQLRVDQINCEVRYCAQLDGQGQVCVE